MLERCDRREQNILIKVGKVADMAVFDYKDYWHQFISVMYRM